MTYLYIITMWQQSGRVRVKNKENRKGLWFIQNTSCSWEADHPVTIGHRRQNEPPRLPVILKEELGDTAQVCLGYIALTTRSRSKYFKVTYIVGKLLH